MSKPALPVAIVALEAEAQTLRDWPQGLDVRVSGPGQDAARRSALAAIEAAPPWIMSWGVAGSLDSNWRPGAIIRPAEVVAESGEVYASNTRSAPALRMASTMQPVRSRMDRLALAERTHAVAVDMESAAIAAVCRDAGIPFVCVRAIADGCDVELPEWIDEAMAADGSLRPVQIARRLLTRPGTIHALIRAGLQFRRALTSLAREARNGALP